MQNNFLPNNNHQFFVEVIVPLNLPITYTWSVPLSLKDQIKIGQRVEVSLRNKKYAGIIKSIFSEYNGLYKPIDILSILDEEPLLFSNQLKLWNWIAQYYMCSEGEVMQIAIPANFKLSSETIIIWNEEANIDLNDGSNFTDNEYIVAQALEIKKELKLSEIQQLLDTNKVTYIVKKLIDKKVCIVWEQLNEKYKPKTETYIILHPKFSNEKALSSLLNNWGNASKQMELILAYLHFSKTEGEVIQKELLKKSNATSAQLKALIDKGIFIAEKRQKDRIKIYKDEVDVNYNLSTAQLNALNEIKEAFTKKTTCLLHGVTGSGKTQLYIKLIESFLINQNQILYILPEIALTTQIIRRLQIHFKNNIAIYHSKLNANERVEIWNKVKNGEIKIILGARSALFLPFKNLQLIVVDEEHDSSFKQNEPAPRYNARDTAIFYASLFNAKVLLGTATPSIETYYNCLQNKYALVNLHERFGEATLPNIELIDLKKIVVHQAGKVPLSPQLIEALQQTIHQGKQAILFQNRRGYSPYILCKTCGWIPHCNHCDVTLTYHKSKNKLACHYCSTTYPVLQTCAACGNSNFLYKNFGTEKLEELVIEHLPQAKIARMDWDTVKGKNEHENIIKLFEQKKLDILVGTQMVVKGLDFENVNLVGIVDADGILNFTDFRVNERAFQLMEQVSGRAGRKDGNGKVMVQVSNLHHPVLQFVKEHNFLKLYEYELESRKVYHYPPFYRIININCKHKDKNIAEQAANIMVAGLSIEFKSCINGPAQPPVDRIRNQYLWEIQLKLPKDFRIIEICKKTIYKQAAIIANENRYKGVVIVYDVDPI